jgi:glycerol-3-phosphate O-acyltransferase / dihydroxyacetone phosphate acyltransferase
MHWSGLSLYRVGRWILGAALGFYFNRIERFHRERVPLTGPVLFTSNHPNSVSDAFVIGVSVPRKVNFVATVQLFRLAPLRWLLTRCGVIPINRVKDDPRAMRTVMDTFEACFKVLERGEAIGIFPEGITHDDPQLKTVKTGAARMALELEHRHQGKLGLHIVPVGLTFSAKEIYRSDVLVNFGEPVRVANYLACYPEAKKECIQKLTADIEARIEALILHLPTLERVRLIEAVKRLYLDRLRVANRVIHEPVPPTAGELLLTQAIARAIEFTYENHPERAAAFVQRLDHYERWLKRLNLTDEELAHLPGTARLASQSVAWAILGILLFPVAAYGWIHRLLPITFVNWAIKRFAEVSTNKTHVSTTAMLAGVVGFSVFYGACVATFYGFFGWPACLWYALSLPVASLVTHYYLRGFGRFAASLRVTLVRLRARAATRRLLARRKELIAEIESARWEVPAEALAQPKKGTA